MVCLNVAFHIGHVFSCVSTFTTSIDSSISEAFGIDNFIQLLQYLSLTFKENIFFTYIIKSYFLYLICLFQYLFRYALFMNWSCIDNIFMISCPMLIQSNPGFTELSTNVAAVARKIHMICLYVT